MYNIAYWTTFSEMLSLPEESRQPLLQDYTRLLQTPGAAEEMQKAEDLLFEGKPWKELVPYMDTLSQSSGLHRHVVDFLFLMAASCRLRENYKAAGYSDALFWDTIADLKYKLIECHDVYGIWGTFVAFWHPWFYTLKRFKLGRLQYEIIDAPEEIGEVTVGGHTVKPGDKIINMHIPSCGPLTKEERIASYKAAYEFYKDQVPSSPMVFTCDSWLLFPKNEEILPENSNIVSFLHDFTVVVSNEGDFHDRWRVFGAYEKLPDNELPEDTTMRRCFKRWLLEGKKTGVGIGIFLYDGENFIR